jgi:hypothetical protein
MKSQVIKHLCTSIFLSIFSLMLHAQIFPTNAIPVIVSGDTLENPWFGGLDLPQFSGADINLDGREDLMIFDRKGNKILAFIKDEDGNYAYAPDLEKFFPYITNFALFKDYNCDGLVDIFAYVNTGIQVFRQEIVNSNISFVLEKSILEFDLGGFDVNIYNSNGDIPGIEDVDGDGDIDVVVFYLSGTTTPLYKNLSVENGFGCDSLIFEEFTGCWGQFQESFSNNSITLDITCKGGPSLEPIPSGGPKHAGSTLLLFDPNEDGKMDLMLGDIAFNSLIFLENDNTSINAHFASYDLTYPSYDTPANVEIFPAAYYVDVTNDGQKDLLVAPNSTTAHVNTTCSWLYENTGNPAEPFTFVKNNFLIEQTIDWGSYSYPILFDHNQDGLLDLIVANGYVYETLGTTDASLFYYENTGNDSVPVFTLMDEDYAGLAALSIDFMRPTFGDIDNDGDDDMILGDSSGLIHFFENTAGAGNTANFTLNTLQYFNIDVGNKAHPILVDINKDNLLDLVIGREGSSGEIAYYWNYGTPSVAQFSIDSSNQALGKIKTNEPGFLFGFSAPFLLETDTQDILFVGSDFGNIAQYIVNPDSLQSGSFEMLSISTLPTKAGIRTNVAIADLNNDEALEFIVGNSRGGLHYFSETPSEDTIIIDTTSIRNQLEDEINFTLYPNPNEGVFTLELEDFTNNLHLYIFDVLGREQANFELSTAKQIFSLQHLPTGVYFAIVKNNSGSQFVKTLIKH